MFIVKLVRFILIFLGIYYIIKLFRGSKRKHASRYRQPSPPAIEEMKKDPICGTFVPASQAHKLTSGKETYYFCSQSCKDKFQKITASK